MKTYYLIAAAALALASNAHAAILSYNISGPVTASFSIDTSIPCTGNNAFQSCSVISPPMVNNQIFNSTVIFSNNAFGGGVDLAGGSIYSQYDFAGPVLYSGTSPNGNLLTGTFSLTARTITDTNGVNINSAPRGNYTLTVSAVPEPAAWAMMIVGMGAIGGTMRRRQRTTVRFA